MTTSDRAGDAPRRSYGIGEGGNCHAGAGDDSAPFALRASDQSSEAGPLGQLSPETLLRMLADAGVGIYATTRTGAYTYANHCFAQLLGFDTAEQLMAAGKRADAFYADPDDQAYVRELNDRGQSVQGRIVRVRRIDGATIWASEHANPIINRAGEVIGYFGSLADVTDLVETQQRLREAEVDYRRMFERASEGIYRSSPDGRQLRANPALCALNGYATEAEQLAAVTDIGREWYVDPTRRDTFREILARDGVVRDFESEVYRHATGERIWISENAYLVRDARGAPLFYEGTVRDITDRKQAEWEAKAALRRAENANRAKSEFLAHMSHELRTPLNAILGFADLLRTMQTTLSPEKLREYVEHIHASGSYLLDLINDILDLARIENDAFPLDLGAQDAQAAVVGAVAAVQPIAAERSIAISVDTAEVQGVQVHADRRALYQGLLNLLSNALKFSPDGGQVSLHAALSDLQGQDGQAVRFSVKDRGPGFPQKLLEKLGEPFLVEAGLTNVRPSGTGLGLAITKALAERMRGKLVAGNRPHGGACACIYIPRIDGKS